MIAHCLSSAEVAFDDNLRAAGGFFVAAFVGFDAVFLTADALDFATGAARLAAGFAAVRDLGMANLNR